MSIFLMQSNTRVRERLCELNQTFRTTISPTSIKEWHYNFPNRYQRTAKVINLCSLFWLRTMGQSCGTLVTKHFTCTNKYTSIFIYNSENSNSLWVLTDCFERFHLNRQQTAKLTQAIERYLVVCTTSSTAHCTPK